MDLTDLNESAAVIPDSREISFSGETVQQMVERKQRESQAKEWEKLRLHEMMAKEKMAEHLEKMDVIKNKVQCDLGVPVQGNLMSYCRSSRRLTGKASPSSSRSREI